MTLFKTTEVRSLQRQVEAIKITQLADRSIFNLMRLEIDELKGWINLMSKQFTLQMEVNDVLLAEIEKLKSKPKRRK